MLSATPAGADEPTYALSFLPVANDWQAIRYQTRTGKSWLATGGEWKPLPEGSEPAPAAGDYQVTLAAVSESDWTALRFDRKTGRSWRLHTGKWVEMKLLPGEEPAEPPVAPGATGTAAEPAKPTLVGSWVEVRKDERRIAIVISQDLSFRQVEQGAPDYSGRMQLDGNKLSLIADDGSSEVFTVAVTADTVLFFDRRGARTDFFWQRQ